MADETNLCAEFTEFYRTCGTRMEPLVRSVTDNPPSIGADEITVWMSVSHEAAPHVADAHKGKSFANYAELSKFYTQLRRHVGQFEEGAVAFSNHRPDIVALRNIMAELRDSARETLIQINTPQYEIDERTYQEQEKARLAALE